MLGRVKFFKMELEKVAAEKAPLEWHIKRLLRLTLTLAMGRCLCPKDVRGRIIGQIRRIMGVMVLQTGRKRSFVFGLLPGM